MYIKGLETEKKKVQLSLTTDDMIIHVKNPKESIRKLVE